MLTHVLWLSGLMHFDAIWRVCTNISDKCTAFIFCQESRQHVVQECWYPSTRLQHGTVTLTMIHVLRTNVYHAVHVTQILSYILINQNKLFYNLIHIYIHCIHNTCNSGDVDFSIGIIPTVWLMWRSNIRTSRAYTSKRWCLRERWYSSWRHSLTVM
jgi:hypothetical protein